MDKKITKKVWQLDEFWFCNYLASANFLVIGFKELSVAFEAIGIGVVI